MKIKNYKDLDIWNKGIDIVDKVYSLTDSFPDTEKFGLVVQMRRCSVSIPSNIAEGFLRQYKKEYRQFLSIALGSCGELETQTIIANRREYLNRYDYSVIEDMLDHESRMIRNVIKIINNS